MKVGVASYLINPGICVYENTSLTTTVPLTASGIALPTFNVSVANTDAIDVNVTNAADFA